MPRKPRRDCRYCKEECSRPEKFFCDSKCQQAFYYEVRIEAWKCGKLTGHVGMTYSLAGWLRRYMLDKHGEKCSKCHWNERHPVTGRVPVEINHKDGNPANCTEENLEVLCPNCHSLTPNFRALNKNSPRVR